MGRKRHPNKHIEAALRAAEALGWQVRPSPNGHAWGHLYCPYHTREGCRISIWSTPKNPENHARHIRRDVDSCFHTKVSQDEGEGTRN
jgi:hypothetical protein